MSTQLKVLKYCAEPRSAIEIAEHCGLQTSSIYTLLGALQRHNKLQKIGDGRRRGSPAVFMTVRQAPVATESTEDYENLVVKFAHNPFGIKHGIAQEIR
jgi:hypothetical protein